MAEPPAKRRQTNLTFEQKYKIISYKESKKDVTQSDINKNFGHIMLYPLVSIRLFHFRCLFQI
jgi:hypothetical protein